MNIEHALRDSRLLGGLDTFRDLTTWAAWLAFTRAVFGHPMTDSDLALFRQHTGRTELRSGGYPEAVAVVGVQSGKTRIAAAFADHAALVGESGTHALLLGQDHRGAMRVLLRYAREPFETIDAFRAEVVRSTVDTLELRNGVSLSAYPCRPASVRGLRACIVVIDELAFFTATDGRPVDTEMLRAARGRLATTGGKLIILSSPYAQTGALYDLHRKHFGRDDSDVLVWQAAAPAMNPTLPADYLTRMAQDDPEAYRSEVLGEFRTGLTTLLDPEALAACVAIDVRERAPERDLRYTAFVDAASGSGKDAFTVAIAHLVKDRAVLDAVRAWKPPFNPSGAIAEAAVLLKTYRISEATGDRYAPGFVSEGFRAQTITYKPSERDRSTIYLDFLPMVNAAKVLLLDDPEALRELRGLERKRGTTGRDRVDHRPGSHDDRANAIAGVLTLVAQEQRKTIRVHQAVWG
jgi:hypothetical protein